MITQRAQLSLRWNEVASRQASTMALLVHLHLSARSLGHFDGDRIDTPLVKTNPSLYRLQRGQEHPLSAGGTPFDPKSWRGDPVSITSRLEVWVGRAQNNNLSQGNSDAIALWKRVLHGHGIRLQTLPYGWPDSKLAIKSTARVSRVSASIVDD